MSLISEALDRLRLDLRECQQSPVCRPLDPQTFLSHLRLTIEALEKKYDVVTVPKAALDPETVWAKWRSVKYDLDKLDSKEKRALCVSPITAMRPKFVQSLGNSPEPLKRLTTFYGFVHAYFALWRTMDDPKSVETLILDLLKQGRIVRKSKILAMWRHNLFLFSPEASVRLAQCIIDDRKSVKQVCIECYVDSSTPLATDAHRRASLLAVARLISKQVSVKEPAAVTEFQWILEHLLGPTLSSVTFRSAIGDLICSRLPEQMPTFQKLLVEVIHNDDRLGDLRLAENAPNWRTMTEESKNKFLAWLAKETLQFFFDTLVPSNDENRRRANFWLQYAKKLNNVKDFQVAVSDDDVYKIKASRAKTIPSYSRVTCGNTSAFLMVFEGYETEHVVIEFSETGNAAYVYTRKYFESGGLKLRSPTFHLTDDLKRRGSEETRIIHNGDWEPKARRVLSELGIRP